MNNGSTDNTEEVINEFRRTALFPVKIVVEPQPGLGRARNSGILQAEGNIIAFTDDDCYLGKNYFRNAISAFEAGDFCYCGGRIFLYDKSDSSYGCNFSETLKIIPPHSFIPAGMIQGANMVIAKKLIDKIGLFDPMFGAGTPFRCEDIDYCAKASMAGFAGAHVPELVVYHHHGRKPGEAIRKLNRSNDFARGAYYIKYILKGEYMYFLGWLRSARRVRRAKSTVGEILGALHYLFTLRAHTAG